MPFACSRAFAPTCPDRPVAIRLASLGSGSKGNGTLVESGDTCVLVDCGFSVRETERRLRRLDREPADLAAILVTHEHGDHGRGVAALARRFGLPVYLTAGTLRGLKDSALGGSRLISGQQSFVLGGMTVTAVTVPHDAREPVQFLFAARDRRVGVLTDLGCITAHVVEQFGRCDGLLLEANHDRAMLANGRYPPSLKRRVAGDRGHLSNDQAAQMIAAMDRARLQVLVLGHISQHNNALDRVAEAVAPWRHELHQVHYACQEQGIHWHEIH